MFLLTNKEIGVTHESVDLDAIELPALADRARAAVDEEYLPHNFDLPGEVPAFSEFGGDNIARFTTSTHDKAAYLTTSPAVIQQMIDHYTAKVEEDADELALVKEDFQDEAEILIISYGITSRSAAVAVREARENGVKVSALCLQTLYPVPASGIEFGDERNEENHRAGNEYGAVHPRSTEAGAHRCRSRWRQQNGHHADFTR